MKKSIFTMLFTVAMLWANVGGQAQSLELEKTYEITRKAKNGNLAQVEYDKNSQVYTLTYMTKANEKRAKFEAYRFDKDFNFVKMDEKEVEFEQAKKEYKWFKFKGDEYSVEGNSVEPNLFGTLILKKKRTTYSYDWFWGGYSKNVKLLEKVKPKTEDGRKFHYYSHIEDDNTGEILVLTGVKGGLRAGGNAMSHQQEFHVLKFNKDLDLVKDTPINFDFIQHLAVLRAMEVPNPEDPDNPNTDGMAMVFAPMGGMGMGKYADPEKTNYTYVRINAAGEVAARIPFKSFATYWQIDNIVSDLSENSTYLFGPSAAGKDKYYNSSLGITKFGAVQLMKINNATSKIEYFTETNLDDFETKLKTPPAQKKAPAYKGKKFKIAGYLSGTNKDFYIYGQNYDPDKNGPNYKDVLAFHFDAKGTLKAQYGIDTRESGSESKLLGAPQNFIAGADNKTMYWLIRETRDIRGNRPLTYPTMGKIDINGATVSDFQVYGAKEKFYLDPKFPMLETETGGRIVFFGSDKKGKTLWFARVKLD